MKVHPYKVAGRGVVVNAVETEEDLEGFRDFVRGNLTKLAIDTETTGLDIYSDKFRLRTVQLGHGAEAWVVPVERGGRFQEDARLAIEAIGTLILHNASYDFQVLDRHLGIPMDRLWRKAVDTRILAHLVDPRGREEGGLGHGLEDLIRGYLDPVLADEVKGLMAKLAREHKVTKKEIWKVIDYDHPEYQLYAGMDCVFAWRLSDILSKRVPNESRQLPKFETELARICSTMEQRGFLLDVEYTKSLSVQLQEREAKFVGIAEYLGCENVNSTEQVADVLETRGVKFRELTATGKRKVDKTLLDQLVKQGDEFAVAVQEAKKARKWRTTWVDTFLSTRDSDDRCHASINPLRARTARMSITGIPAQTLPSKGWLIRRCFLADEGHLMSSIDYQAQELRVLAALSRDRRMIQAFLDDDDLHLITARAAFGDHLTKEANKKERGYGKTANFLKVYGGGAANLAQQLDIPHELAVQILAGFDKAYPGIKPYSKRLQDFARRSERIITQSGRVLPVDRQRIYAALNYEVQSTSRDVTARALLRLDREGFTPYLRLPIHDEVLASLPAEHAEWGASRIGELMQEQMGPVLIATEPEVGGRSWGSLYVEKDEIPSITDPYLLRSAA